MKKWVQTLCFVVSILLLAAPAFALVPVEKAAQGNMKKQDSKKALQSKEKKEKAAIRDREKETKDHQEKKEQTEKASDE